MSSPLRRARSEAAKNQRRLDMLSAARTLALREGVGAVTLAAVTGDAGLHPSAMRRYFASKEELLLELAEQQWDSWSAAVVDRLRDRTDQPPEVIAAVLVQTVAAHPLFCDLSSHVVLSLEDGAGYDRVFAYKENAFAAYDRMAEAMVASSALTLDAAYDVLATTLALVAYLWQVAHPGPTLAAVYVEMPHWGHTASHFEEDLERLVLNAIRGALCGA
jgi:AcrR family transcriptional regulator